MKSVSIIGGGIIGTTLAASLARAGADVTVFDAGDVKVSDGSLAWLNASSTLTPHYAGLRAASMRLWHDLAQEQGCPVRFNGALMWGLDVKAEFASVEVMAGVGWNTKLVNDKDMGAIAPELNAPQTALWSPDEGFADPLLITEWMRARAETLGAKFQNRRVDDVDQVDSGHVVVCAGNGSTDLLPGLPLRRSPGIVMRTNPVPPVVPCVMASPKLDFWQGSDGRIVMSSSLSKTPERADGLMAEDALEELKRLFPGLSAEVEDVVRRDRPIPKDGFPLLGHWQDRTWVAAMHSGMTLAPVVAAALTAELLDLPRRHDISRYRPDREMADHERSAV